MDLHQQDDAFTQVGADRTAVPGLESTNAMDRIERLEAQTALLTGRCQSLIRLLRLGAAFVVGVAVVFIGAGFAQKDGILRAERIIITDAEGHPRGMFGTLPSGTVSLVLASSKDGGRATLTVTKEGIADFNLGVPEEYLVSLGAIPNGTAHVIVRQNENSYVAIRQSPSYGELRFLQDSKTMLYARHLADNTSEVTVTTPANDLTLSSSPFGAKLKSSSNLGKFTIGELRPAIYGVETETMGGKTKKTIDFNDLK